jgi:hypothetical protein
MPRYLFLLIVLIGICSQLQGMEEYRPQPNDILRFNIGGCKWDVTRQTIEQFGGDYLNALLNGEFDITRDIKGRIFIDRPQKEAEYIQHFILTQQLPAKFERNIAISAAQFFGIEAMEKYIEEKKDAEKKTRRVNKKPKMSEVRMFERLMQCPKCRKNQLSDIFDCILHLTNVHNAEIIDSNGGYNCVWGVLYRVPLDEPEDKK